tara:strand:+ start:957 stop:2174 length:1218 start_codon:yes stop_codon:yes gene_type:complete
MKILFLTDNFPPEMNAPANRTFEHCREWMKYPNVEITIITGVPNFPRGVVYKGYKNKFYQKEIVSGIEIIRVWTYIAENKNTFRRTIDYVSFCISSFIAGLFQKFDVIIGTSPQFFTVISAFLLAKCKRKPWIFELRDLWPESIKSVGLIKNNLLYKYLEKLELLLYSNADLIVTVTDSFKNKLIKKNINKSKIVVHKNGVLNERFIYSGKNQYLINKYKLKNKFIVGYIGTQGLAHGLDFILNSINNFDEKFHFIFIGGGAKNESLKNISKLNKMNNITFIDFKPKDEIIKFISIIDVALVNLKKSDTFKMVIPSKIFENASMGKPILLGVEGEAKEIINHYRAGICFKPEQKTDFINKLNLIKATLDENSNYYSKGLKSLSKDFDRKLIAKNMFYDIKKYITI